MTDDKIKEAYNSIDTLQAEIENGDFIKCEIRDLRKKSIARLEAAKEAIKDQTAEIERLKEEKERAIRDIDLYIADAESDAKTPPRTGKGYSVGLGHGLQIAKEILQGIRKHG